MYFLNFLLYGFCNTYTSLHVQQRTLLYVAFLFITLHESLSFSSIFFWPSC